MRYKNLTVIIGSLFLFVAIYSSSLAEDFYSPYVGKDYPRNVYWGDTHLHTSYSTDAGLVGNILGPEDAYKFALGEEVVSSTGVRAKLVRPYDFLVVADHAENLGLAPMIAESNQELLKTEFGKKLHELVKTGKWDEAYAAWGSEMGTGKDPLKNDELTGSMWQRITSAAEKYNNPGEFTALIGFEWTSSPGGNNLHRNVIFRDGKDKADKVLPFSNYDSTDPEDLWKWMAAYEKNTGGKLFAIPHNGNLSNGLMFDEVTLTEKKPLTRDYAERRARWEPIYEVTQIKGDGETHPRLSPNDEFADYGTWDKGSFGSAKKPGMIEKEYARQALMRGLKYEQELGANPFKFGMVGSTDSHTSLSTTEENNFFGKVPPVEPSAKSARFNEKITGYLPDPEGKDYSIYAYESLASGLAAVWARDNTREELFDAFKRKEVYATTGTRITVRFFGGWEYKDQDVQSPNYVDIGYSKGVPMGGDLTKAPEGKAPSFMMHAVKDPDGANLDRIQVIKGWLDKDGNLKEKVYDVALSDNRTAGSDGKVPLVGNTVDVKKATYTNSIGDPELAVVWTDPDFNPKERAFYYGRVLEIPTPRWTTYDAAFYGVDLPEGVPTSEQERAYTSPIWFTP